MPTTYSTTLPSLSSKDVLVKSFSDADRALLVYNGPDPSVTNPNIATGSYTYNGGSPDDTIQISVRKEYNPKTDTARCSARLIFEHRKTISETGEVVDTPAEAGIFWNHSGRVAMDPTDVLESLEAIYSLMTWELAGANGLPTDKVVSQVNRGILSKLFA